jgi:hypothetical protein
VGGHPHTLIGTTMTDQLVRCLYFERATAHLLLGALARIPSLDAKLALARHQHHAMLRATRLERELTGIDLAVPREWREFIAEADAAAPRALVRCLCIDVATDLLHTYREARPQLEAPLADVVDSAIREILRELRWVRQLLGVSPADPRRTPAGVDYSDVARSIPRDWWLGKPRDRAPRPVRPAKLRPTMLPVRGRREPVHEHVDAELATMELLARCSYEHPEMPEAFHRDISRQVAQHSRHAAALAVAAARLGTPLGTWLTSTDAYDLHYEYALCQPGSQRELLWRLLLTTKEAFHGGWSRYLCAGDDALVAIERDAAQRYIAGEFAEVSGYRARS